MNPDHNRLQALFKDDAAGAEPDAADAFVQRVLLEVKARQRAQRSRRLLATLLAAGCVGLLCAALLPQLASTPARIGQWSTDAARLLASALQDSALLLPSTALLLALALPVLVDRLQEL